MKAGGKIISLQPPSLSSSWGITIAEKLLVTKQHQSRFLMGVVAARYYVQIFIFQSESWDPFSFSSYLCSSSWLYFELETSSVKWGVTPKVFQAGHKRCFFRFFSFGATIKQRNARFELRCFARSWLKPRGSSSNVRVRFFKLARLCFEEE